MHHLLMKAFEQNNKRYDTNVSEAKMLCFVVQVLSYNDGAYLYRLAMEPHELNATLRPDAAYAKISNERRNVHG